MERRLRCSLAGVKARFLRRRGAGRGGARGGVLVGQVSRTRADDVRVKFGSSRVVPSMPRGQAHSEIGSAYR